MNEELITAISRRLDADASISDDAGLLVLAACDGDATLMSAISGDFAPYETEIEERGTAEPGGAYLRSITVEGFRGIGPPRTLELTPGPGLTLVVGRNGCGKSSFVEALEVLLTDESRRWSARREKVWGQGC